MERALECYDSGRDVYNTNMEKKRERIFLTSDNFKIQTVTLSLIHHPMITSCCCHCVYVHLTRCLFREQL